MIDANGRQPVGDESLHAVPADSAVLATTRKHTLPEPAHLGPKGFQRGLVHGHSIVADVSTYDRAEPLAHFWDGIVHATPKLGFHFAPLRLQPFANRLPSPCET